MSEAVQAFLKQLPPRPGLAAWSARLANRSIVSHCFSDWFKPGQVEQAISRLAVVAEGLSSHSMQPARLCWVFDRARIHLVLRPDAACLALFVENRPGLETRAVEQILVEFGALLA